MKQNLITLFVYQLLKRRIMTVLGGESMATSRVTLSVRLTPESNAKLKKIAKSEVRSVANLIDYLVQKEIARYESEHGEIEVTEEELYS